MADSRLTDKTAYAGILNLADLIHIVDVSDTSQDPAGSSYKLMLSDLKQFVVPALSSVLNAGRNADGTGTIRDSSSVDAININSRYLMNTAGSFTVDWETCNLNEPTTNNIMVDWTNGLLADNGSTTVNWLQGKLYDPSTSNEVLNWDTKTLTENWAIAGNFSPTTNNTRDLGTATEGWANLYLASNINYATDLLFKTATVEKMRLTTGGFLGIGTTSPGCALQVDGTYVTTLNPAGVHTRGNVSGVSFETTGGNANERRWAILNRINTDGVLEFLVSTTNANDPSSTALQLDRSGNVAIGTSSPGNANKLYAGSLNISGNFYTDAAPTNGAIIEGNTSIGLNTNSAKLHIKGSGSGSGTYSLKIQNSASTDILSVRDDARVGIKTTSPQGVLDITDNAEDGTYITSTGVTRLNLKRTTADSISAGALRYLASDNTVKWNIATSLVVGADNLEFNRGSLGNAMLIERTTGNVIIASGSFSPTAKFHVKGVGTGTGSGLLVEASDGTDNFEVLDNGTINVGRKSIDTTAGDSATINAVAGRFRKDTSGTTFTLTNSYITANSIIQLTPANAAIDATAITWTVSAGAGSAIIEFNLAPTANFDMNFLIIN